MRYLNLLCLGVAVFIGNLRAETQPIYQNYGLVENPPIDATVVVNKGTIQVTPYTSWYYFASGDYIFDTQNTMYFTNQSSGLIEGSIGFQFDFSAPDGRKKSDYFVNNGVIHALDFSGIGGAVSGNNGSDTNSYILTYNDPYYYFIDQNLYYGIGTVPAGSVVVVDATNVINRGTLSTELRGIVKITGDNVRLNRSAVRASTSGDGTLDSIYSVRPYSFTENVYYNQLGISDLDNNGLTSKADKDKRLFPSMFNDYSPSNGYISFIYTNRSSPTNILIQSVFVVTNVYSYLAYNGTNYYIYSSNSLPTNITVDVRFTRGGSSGSMWIFPSVDPRDPGMIATVQFALRDTDISTGLPVTNSVYLIDNSAINFVGDHWHLMSNAVTIPVTMKPTAYEVTRSMPYEFYSGTRSNAVFHDDTYYRQDYAAAQVTNLIATYGFAITAAKANVYQNDAYSTYYGSGSVTYYYDSATGLYSYSSPYDIGYQNPSNWFGRVEIAAGNLDLTDARVRADGQISIKANHLINASGLVMDSPHINLELGSTNGSLVLSNVLNPTTTRLGGSLQATTYVWTNMVPDSMVATNTNEVKFSVLVITPSLTGQNDVQVDNLIVKATNSVINDRLLVNNTFRIDSENVTIGNELQLLNTTSLLAENMGVENFPSLKRLTNSSMFYIPNIAVFGLDRLEPLDVFVNSGSIRAGSAKIGANIFENSGTIYSSQGPLTIDAVQAKFDHAINAASGDLEISTGDLKFRNTTMYSQKGTIVLNVTNRLADGGVGASNIWSCASGFQLLTRPETGDLLYTTVNNSLAPYVVTENIWSARDFGPCREGFSNNVAIGTLVIDGDYRSQVLFSGTGSNSALYVDYLVLLNTATNVANIQVGDNMNVYFASANVPAAQLDGKAGGRLHWVAGFAGPSSSTNYTNASGLVFTINKSLLASTNIDSDADGKVNANDTTPFGGVQFSSVSINPANSNITSISWTGAAYTTYQVEYATNLVSPNWTYLLSTTNNNATNSLITVQDTQSKQGNQRYYRVGYTP